LSIWRPIRNDRDDLIKQKIAFSAQFHYDNLEVSPTLSRMVDKHQGSREQLEHLGDDDIGVHFFLTNLKTYETTTSHWDYTLSPVFEAH